MVIIYMIIIYIIYMFNAMFSISKNKKSDFLPRSQKQLNALFLNELFRAQVMLH